MISLSKPWFDEAEIEAVKEVLQSGWVAGQGPVGMRLSEEIGAYTGVKYAIPVNNCTAGLHLALLAMGITRGDEVLVSDFTFPATGHSVMYCGATPRFVDVKPDTYNINPALIEEKITKKTKAIIVVHALGQMAEMDTITEIARRNNLQIIEDAACALGATFNGLGAGQYGDITAFSFHARKNVTSGEGGIVVTNNESYAAKIKALSCFGMESAFTRQNEFSVPVFSELGYNYKLSDINAAIALVQLKKYDKVLEHRLKLVSLYNTLLAERQEITLPVIAEKATSVFQTYAVVLNEFINRNSIIHKMRENGVQTQIGTYSSFIQPVYNNIEDKCPVSLRLFEHSLALPLFHEMTESQVETVVNTLIKIVENE
jgi:perosamine synthetase